MRDQAAILVLLLSACSHARIPYDLSAVASRDRPVHPLRVAVVPLTDGRLAVDGPDSADRYVYSGVEFRHTDLRDLRAPPTVAVTTVLARHLARARVFAQVIVVDTAADAPEADLILSGVLVRARGYVEANERKPDPRKPDAGKPQDERTVLAEVMLADLELTENRGDRRRLLVADVGWSVLQERSATPEPPSPWSVLAAAIRPALDQLVDVIGSADLSGAFVVQPQVALRLPPASTSTTAVGPPFGALKSGPPPGWRFEAQDGLSTPHGWKAAKATCSKAQVIALQTRRFHRVLGPYVPTVELWSCPAGGVLRYDTMIELPAEYLGARVDGRHVFVHAVGRSNWPGAREELRAHLGITPPATRYVFEVGP